MDLDLEVANYKYLASYTIEVNVEQNRNFAVDDIEMEDSVAIHIAAKIFSSFDFSQTLFNLKMQIII